MQTQRFSSRAVVSVIAVGLVICASDRPLQQAKAGEMPLAHTTATGVDGVDQPVAATDDPQVNPVDPPAKPSGGNTLEGNTQVGDTQEGGGSDDGESSVPAVPAEEFDVAVNLETFDKVWKTVASTHWDEDLINEKWEPAREKYRPQVESAGSTAMVRKIIQTMIDELELSHFGIIQGSAFDVIDSADGEGAGDATAGIEFRLIDESAIVTKVEEGSSAAEAGVKPGWELKRVGKFDSQELLEKFQAAARGPVRRETLAGLTLSELASGIAGTSKTFQFLDGDDQVRDLELELRPAAGKMAVFGHLPPMRVQTIIRTLPDQIGYYWFNAFLDPIRLMPEFRTMIRDPNHRSGIIIDLRGNIGGLGAMTMGMASEFSDSQASMGVMTMKGAELKFLVNKNPDPVRCPVAVLIDECSISSAEIFSGGLQDLGRARVFGQRTAGLALPSVVIRLPNGDGFQYAMANYHSASGETLEMNGVTPDETILLNRELLLSDPDPVLSRAIQWVKQQQK
jgi:carboxyl-terminal processing protease